ncbi:hypothetical protein ACPW7J_04180 [Ihubacter sp. rT4E-8]|uniref:hypothetical protein n=1 Tax=unclassified Ihubacter TaxID=2633299 RepID=UPI00192A673D
MLAFSGISIFLVLLIPVILLFSVGLPLIIGICVYRDADKRVDCSPVLWALVAALAPSFIGLVIYLVVRRDYPLKGDEAGSAAYFKENYESKAVGRQPFPTWAKALIIIGVVIAAICILTVIGSVIFGFINYDGGFGHDHGAYYNGF